MLNLLFLRRIKKTLADAQIFGKYREYLCLLFINHYV